MKNAERGRQIAAVKRAAKDRYQGGCVPFGYRKNLDGCLEEDPETYKVLQQIKEAKGNELNPRKLANGLNERGIKISHMTIWRIMKKTINP